MLPKHYSLTLILDDHAVFKKYENTETFIDYTEMAENWLFRALAGIGKDVNIVSSDFTQRDTYTHYAAFMIASEKDLCPLREAIEKALDEEKAGRLLTAVSAGFDDWEVREEAVREFLKEAIDNANLPDEEEKDAKSSWRLYRMLDYAIDDIREVFGDHLDTYLSLTTDEQSEDC